MRIHPMSHVNHNGNRHVEHIADPENPVLAHAEPEPHAKGPHDPKEINPKMASDIAYWSKEFGVTGQQLHAAIDVHGTHVDKVRLALHPHKEAQPNRE
jgi:hypothetical protein